jgi:cystathionine beta-lyase
MFLRFIPFLEVIHCIDLTKPVVSVICQHQPSAQQLMCFWSCFPGDVEVSKIIVNETKLFKITVSFGNVVSLISLPCYMSHASIPAEVRAARGLPDDLVRISAGIENIDDLLTDLTAAFDKAAAYAAKQQAAAAGSNGASSGSGSSSSNGNGMRTAMPTSLREEELMQRVLALEQQLQQMQGTNNVLANGTS